MASLVSFFITIFIYLKQGIPHIDAEVLNALFLVFKFWFILLWNITFLFALFRSIKYIFNRCFNGYKLILLTCPKKSKSEVIELIGYGDLVKVWRKWFMLLIWLVGAQIVIALIFTLTFTSYDGLFDWFNIYILFSFVIFAGYFSFIILTSRCKRVKIKKC
jgi:hypothetical protein